MQSISGLLVGQRIGRTAVRIRLSSHTLRFVFIVVPITFLIGCWPGSFLDGALLFGTKSSLMKKLVSSTYTQRESKCKEFGAIFGATSRVPVSYEYSNIAAGRHTLELPELETDVVHASLIRELKHCVFTAELRTSNGDRGSFRT